MNYRASQFVAFCLQDLMMLFICSVGLAALMEKTNLHRRIALNTMRIIGVAPSRLFDWFHAGDMVHEHVDVERCNSRTYA